ncbi:MAG: UDP-N-acetylmuramoyl-L-alanine--D-glutamate ligase, partial [Candidatus Parcubacteria bacterium]|nr:UDP-N-acetylmuramoyl-L-alanine--D-glutamate ligase [Candidatus Parcubacteria bacterium]
CKQVVMLAGTAKPKLIQALKRAKYPNKNIIEFNNFKRAICFAQTIAQRGDIVLLSPGCASFGMFANEFDRGKQFVQLIRRLKTT